MMNKKELCDYIQRYGNTQYKKGYDAGRSDERKLIAECSQQRVNGTEKSL